MTGNSQAPWHFFSPCRETNGQDIVGCTAENTPSVFIGHCCCCRFPPPPPTHLPTAWTLPVGGGGGCKLYCRRSKGTLPASSLIQSRASLVPRVTPPDSWSALGLWAYLFILLLVFLFLIIIIIYSEYFHYFARHPKYQVSSSRPIIASCVR